MPETLISDRWYPAEAVREWFRLWNEEGGHREPLADGRSDGSRLSLHFHPDNDTEVRLSLLPIHLEDGRPGMVTGIFRGPPEQVRDDEREWSERTREEWESLSG